MTIKKKTIDDSRPKTELTIDALKIQDPEKVCNQITIFIGKKVKELHRDGVAVALSGGIDSSVVAYLAAKAVGADKVLGINMPEKDSDPKVRNEEDSKLVAEELGIRFETKNLTSILKELGTYDLVPTRLLGSKKLAGSAFNLYYRTTKAIGRDQFAGGLLGAQNRFTAKGRAYANSKHRVRLVYLYLRAEAENLLIAGAANKTEYSTGFFVKGGVDGVADIMPIRGLYKPQVKQIAGHLKVPKRIIEKQPHPDVLLGVNDKDVLGSHDTVALILFGLENRLSIGELYSQFGKKEVDRIVNIVKDSRHMRRPPETPDLSI